MSKRGCFLISLALGTVFLLGIMACGGLFYFGWGMVKAPMLAVVDELNAEPEATEKLGSPIEMGSSFTFSEFQNQGGNGHAEVDFNVYGPSGGAQVKGRVDLTANKWRSEDILVKFDDGTEMRLPKRDQIEGDADLEPQIEEDETGLNNESPE